MYAKVENRYFALFENLRVKSVYQGCYRFHPHQSSVSDTRSLDRLCGNRANLEKPDRNLQIACNIVQNFTLETFQATHSKPGPPVWSGWTGRASHYEGQLSLCSTDGCNDNNTIGSNKSDELVTPIRDPGPLDSLVIPNHSCSTFGLHIADLFLWFVAAVSMIFGAK